jgi:hypothetical protein
MVLPIVFCDIMPKPANIAKNKAIGRLVMCENKTSAPPKINKFINKTLLKLTPAFNEAKKNAPPTAPSPIALLR